jgi:hypothetical protein
VQEKPQPQGPERVAGWVRRADPLSGVANNRDSLFPEMARHRGLDAPDELPSLIASENDSRPLVAPYVDFRPVRMGLASWAVPLTIEPHHV